MEDYIKVDLLKYNIISVINHGDNLVIEFTITNKYNNRTTDSNYMYCFSDRWSIRLDYSNNMVTSYEYDLFNELFELSKSKNFELLYRAK